ncbi:hypothetical protein N665_0876s0002 [Sinapis alba]|nr:hypothetical protein N665_0876s0002 [Sinapis alba]
MGSRFQSKSAHMADIKGKRIKYDEDDPVQLIEEDDSRKILNPTKQIVEKLIQMTPYQWRIQDRITANDMGNVKFMFNFSYEGDLNYVLRKGSFHYNFCMFVLVRWEPKVHDDYPWIIAFWVCLVGIPLHLWTVRNLRNIGGRLRHVNTMELEEGRMLIDVDFRLPLKFKRKGSITGGRRACHSARQPSLREQHHYDYQPRATFVPSSNQTNRRSPNGPDVYSFCAGGERFSHTDRIIRRKDERPRGHQYNGSRFGSKPYDRHLDCNTKQRWLRDRDAARSLSFSPNVVHDAGADTAIIGALSDMEIIEQTDETMLEREVQKDNLLGVDLMEMEDLNNPHILQVFEVVCDESMSANRVKSGKKMCASLGIHSKKNVFLRRGSPHQRSAKSSALVIQDGTEKTKRSCHVDSKEIRASPSTSDGLMSSRNSLKRHL